MIIDFNKVKSQYDIVIIGASLAGLSTAIALNESKQTVLIVESGSKKYNFKIKKKSDAVAEKENQQYGKFVGKEINELKMELGKPTEDFIGEKGNKIFVFKSKKYGISCERKFEVNEKNIIISFTSSGCI